MHIFFPNGTIQYPPRLGGTVHRFQLIKNLVDLGCTVSTFENDENPLTQKHKKSVSSTLKLLRTCDAVYVRVGESPDSATRLTLWPRSMILPRRVPVVWECNVSLLHSCKMIERTETQIQSELGELRRSAQRVDGAVAVTQPLKEQVECELGITNTIWLPNASDPTTFRQGLESPDGFQIDRNRLNVTYIASFTNSHHDVDILEQTGQQIDEQRLPIDIHVFGACVELFKPNGANCIKLHGPVSYLELPNYLSQMQVGLALYNRNVDFGSPLKLFDYLASGCIPICSEAKSMREILDGTDIGYVENWSANKLVSVLKILCDNPEELERKRLAGRKLVEEKFNWRRVAEKTLELIEQCMGRRLKR